MYTLMVAFLLSSLFLRFVLLLPIELTPKQTLFAATLIALIVVIVIQLPRSAVR